MFIDPETVYISIFAFAFNLHSAFDNHSWRNFLISHLYERVLFLLKLPPGMQETYFNYLQVYYSFKLQPFLTDISALIMKILQCCLSWVAHNLMISRIHHPVFKQRNMIFCENLMLAQKGFLNRPLKMHQKKKMPSKEQNMETNNEKKKFFRWGLIVCFF